MNIELRLLAHINSMSSAEFSVQGDIIGGEEVIANIGRVRVKGIHPLITTLLYQLAIATLNSTDTNES